MASCSGHERLLKLLIKTIKDYNPKELKALLNPDQYISPLHIAIENNHLAIVKILLSEGSDVTLKHSIFNVTPLEAAIRYEQE